ncbi:hypothetical protein [Falsibacillus albus]|uniref:Uncharacterized protein n=1 Tax=Falsibacillus albus TaxID=2478915 RepID=A0A3L7JZ07_9BACI|nr:hypothetical protein [Falsibacillus albus]RLQ96118.1 hypothetical protein D9X91_07435 [Falsibacillus albus]
MYIKKFSLVIIAIICLSLSVEDIVSASTISSLVDYDIEVLHWKDVNKIIPRYAKFTVIDVESGKSFNVQRRAGTHHADVQPLTQKDTKIMKDIYGGKWSWRRRAILIMANNRLLAASMHGMPHGAGALDNGFPGHFCIHFIGSVTHKSERSDLAHNVMILKAGGKVDEFMKDLNPVMLTNVFMVTVKNADKGLSSKLAITNEKKLNSSLKKLGRIEAIQWNVLIPGDETSTNKLIVQVPVEVKMVVEGEGAIHSTINYTLIRTSPISPWKINIDPLVSLID